MIKQRWKSDNYYWRNLIFISEAVIWRLEKMMAKEKGQMDKPGADPGFQVRGAHLKKMRRVEGGAKMFGVFRVKNHDFTPKNLIFSNFRWGARRLRPLDPPLCRIRNIKCLPFTSTSVLPWSYVTFDVLCCCFVCSRSVSCTQCFLYLWIVQSSLVSLTFI